MQATNLIEDGNEEEIKELISKHKVLIEKDINSSPTITAKDLDAFAEDILANKDTLQEQAKSKQDEVYKSHQTMSKIAVPPALSANDMIHLIGELEYVKDNPNIHSLCRNFLSLAKSGVTDHIEKSSWDENFSPKRIIWIMINTISQPKNSQHKNPNLHFDQSVNDWMEREPYNVLLQGKCTDVLQLLQQKNNYQQRILCLNLKDTDTSQIIDLLNKNLGIDKKLIALTPDVTKAIKAAICRAPKLEELIKDCALAKDLLVKDESSAEKRQGFVNFNDRLNEEAELQVKIKDPQEIVQRRYWCSSKALKSKSELSSDQIIRNFIIPMIPDLQPIATKQPARWSIFCCRSRTKHDKNKEH